ncbi:four helix bundle protein [Iodobacter sp. CM08]|uniref:four helix bundle protein n=1 Tax=Iodobacter sp. CM08 TaxID=3085902 RepID=UPI002981A881|nr:four helix bundle protein [Iodobacter sp. CM08]MDW5416883.1 four helix bundle protein [Iodobacter sp. CM08]
MMNEKDSNDKSDEFSTHHSSFSIAIPVRTFEFAIRVVRLCQFLEKQGKVSQTLANQLLRSGTSIGANTEEAQAGQSKADFIAKMSIARKESRETLYWLKLLQATNLVETHMIKEIIQESDELVRILTSIVKTAQQSKQHGK